MENTKKPFINIESKVLGIFAPEEFSQLTTNEKLYTYHLSRAAWEGCKICFFQSTYESPGLFILFQYIFNQPINQLKKDCISSGISEDDWNKFCLYFAAFLQNTGNLLSFGDTKFIPEVAEEIFFKIIQNSFSYKNEDLKPIIDNLWNKTKGFVYCFEKPFDSRGLFPDGLTGYYSSDLEKEEVVLVNDFMKIMNISCLNTRIGKINSSEYVILIASVNIEEKKTHYYKEKKIHIVTGDYSSILRRVSYHLDKAIEFAANKNQKKMLENYVRHFNTGDIEHHKNSQRDWVKDVGPIIESDFGFIETYQDPTGVRAEFEGFVAVVNKKQSEQTAKVVSNADKFLENSPWPRDFEKDKFLKPDFTSLSVVSFGCSGTPIGINIPNYDDIRQNEGFKNVYLGNCLGKPTTIDFIETSLADNLLKYYTPCMFHIVIFHELLGHGCGKLLQEDSTGVKNFDPNIINPCTGKVVETWYKGNDTSRTVFGKLYSAYEECRADSVALYYSCFPESIDTLQIEYNGEWKEIMEGVFTEYVVGGLKSLQYYNLEKKEFSQAHVHGGYVILQVLLEAGNNFIIIEKTKKDNKDWIAVKIDTKQILTTGLNAIKNFLLKLNVFKSTADFEKATKLFAHYSVVNEFFLEIREIVVNNKKPRRIELQGNVELKNTGSNNEVVYKTYPETMEGVLESFKNRFSTIDNEMLSLWENSHEFMKPL